MVKRGEVYWYNLGEPRGSVQGGNRPALVIQDDDVDAVVVQNDYGNGSSPTTVVAILSRQIPSKSYPFHVRVPKGTGGLDEGVVKCEQVFTVNQNELGGLKATLPEDLMEKVDQAICKSLGLKYAKPN